MRVLVVGSGAREHAILWKLAQSPRNPGLFAAPGNAGTASVATNLPVAVTDLDGLVAAAREHGIDLTIVGPELPLTVGIVDRFRQEGLRIFGPTQAAARIEGSKSFARGIMRDAGAPTPAFEVFDDADAAQEYVRSQGVPIVVKADGLAAGKGVVVAQSVDEALEAVSDAMVDRAFGASGERVVIEQCLTGQELSVFCFTDGAYVTPLVPACDYKRVFDGDRGPNTGGMGGYSPPPWWDAAMEQRIRETCIEPVIREMVHQGSPFTGVLYGGLMLTGDGPFIIEFNARLGDPEAQLILPEDGERPPGRGRGHTGRFAALARSALERRVRRRGRARSGWLPRPARDRQAYRWAGRGGARCGGIPCGHCPWPKAAGSLRAAHVR